LTGAAAAGPDSKNFAGAGHVPQLDGPVTTVATPDGRTLAAWAYRTSGEFDIAVTVRDADSQTWSVPVFFGSRNGSDELQPAMTIDSRGTVYVAFATVNPSRVKLSVLHPGSDAWSAPVTVSGTDIASSPTLMVVGERLIVGFRTARGVGLVNLPISDPGNEVNGLQDGPDTSGPPGFKGGSLPPPPNTTNGG
jgi:hypothetical protein